MQPGKALDDRWQDLRRPFRTAELHLARAWIGQELDLANTLLEFVERGPAASEQGAAKDRQRHAARAAVEKPCPEGVLQVRDQLRDGGLRHPEPRWAGCLTRWTSNSSTSPAC